MRKQKKNAKPKERNWLAIHSFQRGGAGAHKNRKRAEKMISDRQRKHKGRRLDD